MPDHRSYSGRRSSPHARGQGSERPDPKRESPALTEAEASRLNRYIARAGVCSRRKADELIVQGRVRVDGRVVTQLGTRIHEGADVVVDGRSISPSRHVYLLMNKPRDTITTTDDPRNRRTVLDLVALPEEKKSGLFPVGRLDRDTVGVLLLTNDGLLAHRLMHPSYEVEKLYRVRTKDAVKPHQLEMLKQGVELDDGPAAADDAAYVELPDHHVVGLRVHEGRNRLIRRMFEALGHEVLQLERVTYGGLTARGIRPGKWRRLESHEIRRLRRQVKLK